MSPPDAQVATPPPQPASARVRLAHAAQRALAGMPGVALSTRVEHGWQTAGGDHVIRGVLAIAEPGGRYELALQLVVDWPPAPLHRIGEEVSRRVRAVAEQDGLAAQLGEIQVQIVDVLAPEDLGPTGTDA